MLYIEPHAGPAPMVQVITDARHTVDLNVYYLSSKPILSALRRAHARGVNVRVILDQHPYGIKPWMVRKEARAVRETGATLHWAPSRFEAGAGHYRFDHAKYVVSGHEVEIGTANFDWSAFHKNREYLNVTGNTAIVKAAQRVFDADWNDQKAGPYPHQVLVLSPGSVTRMVSVIDQPGPVDIESEEMGDDRTILSAIAAKGHAARVILPASISAEDQRNVADLEQHGVQVRLMPKSPIYMHAKAEIAGDEAFIGSENYSTPSLNENREMGLVLRGREVAQLRTQFDQDWRLASRGGDVATHPEYGRRFTDRIKDWWHHHG